MDPLQAPVDFTEADINALLDSTPDAIVIADISGSIVFVNTRAEAMFNYHRDDLLGRPVETLLPERYRDSHAIYRRRFFDNTRVRPMGADLELVACREDGSEFPVEISLSPVHTASGTLVSSAIRDVCKHQEIERSLTAAREEAERANRAKSAFLAAAVHDLRQPLQTLQLLNAVLERTAQCAQATRAVDRQSKSLEAMTNLLDSLYEISKLESGATIPAVTDCNVRAIFQRLRAAFEPQAENKGLRLLMEDCDSVLRTDPDLLERIIQNLLANAVRYTKQGSVQLRCRQLDGNVRIEVLDTGVGIPVDELDNIFDEFYQFDRGAAPRPEGLGLGLSIVHRLANLLQHPLQVESAPGKGTCFAITVPQGARDRTVGSPSASRRYGALRPVEVLLIDDDPAVADATSILLEVEGHAVSLAATLAEAMDKLTHGGTPDVIVSDYHLSDATGVDAIKRLRAVGGHEIPAIIVTGDFSSTVADHVRTLDRCHVLNKPVNIGALLELISGPTLPGRTELPHAGRTAVAGSAPRSNH